MNKDLSVLAKQFLTRVYALEVRLPTSAVEAVDGERGTPMEFCQHIFESNGVPFFGAENVREKDEVEVQTQYAGDEKMKGAFEEDDAPTPEAQYNPGTLAALCQAHHEASYQSIVQEDH